MVDGVFVDVDPEARPGGNGDVRVDDRERLHADLLAVLERAHQVRRVGEVREGGGKVQPHRGCDAELDHAARPSEATLASALSTLVSMQGATAQSSLSSGSHSKPTPPGGRRGAPTPTM
jgi:hypothetical protein